jgi:hypothetical protein
VGNGLDYTSPALAPRLARDGEGEIVGWDFIDGDTHPYTAQADTAARVAAASPNTRLIAVRIDPAVRESHAAAIGFLRRTPASIALLELASPFQHGWQLILRAAAATPHMLLVVPALPAGNLDSAMPADAPEPPPNLLVVAAAAPARVSGHGARTVDVEVETGLAGDDPAAAVAAAARAVALGAEILQKQTALTGGELKASIMGMAQAPSAGEPRRSRGGIIAAGASAGR